MQMLLSPSLHNSLCCSFKIAYAFSGILPWRRGRFEEYPLCTLSYMLYMDCWKFTELNPLCYIIIHNICASVKFCKFIRFKYLASQRLISTNQHNTYTSTPLNSCCTSLSKVSTPSLLPSAGLNFSILTQHDPHSSTCCWHAVFEGEYVRWQLVGGELHLRKIESLSSPVGSVIIGQGQWSTTPNTVHYKCLTVFINLQCHVSTHS